MSTSRHPNVIQSASVLAVKQPPRTPHDAETMLFHLSALEGPHAVTTAVRPTPVRPRADGTPPPARGTGTHAATGTPPAATPVVARAESDAKTTVELGVPSVATSPARVLTGIIARETLPTMVMPSPAQVATTVAPSPAMTQAKAGRVAQPAVAPASRPAPAAPAITPSATVAGTPAPGQKAARTSTSIAAPLPQLASDADHAAAFALVRRVAMQRDLREATALLQTGLGDLVGAKIVLVLFDDDAKPWTPTAADLDRAVGEAGIQALAVCAGDREVVVGKDDRFVIAPVSIKVSAAMLAWRTGGNKLDARAGEIVGTVAHRLGVLDHFLADQATRDAQVVADRKSVFRPEALAAARNKNREGDMVHLSPRWTRIALPTVLVLSTVLGVLAAVVQVPTYSRGSVIVRMNGTNVISNTGGRIAETLVVPGQRVSAGEPLVVLDTTAEVQAFDQFDRAYREQLGSFLTDTTDEQARQALTAISPTRSAAKEALTAKTITAPVDGVVSSILASDIVSAGEHVMTIVPDGSTPSVLAFMPGADRSRIQPGMMLQVELSGHTHTRQHLEIVEVEREVLGQMQARKRLGQKHADSIQLPATVVVVKARLASTTFESKGGTHHYFDGMDGVAEIEIDTKSFVGVVFGTGD